MEMKHAGISYQMVRWGDFRPGLETFEAQHGAMEWDHPSPRPESDGEVVLLAHGTALHLPEGEKAWTTTAYLKGWITGRELSRTFDESPEPDYQYSYEDALAEHHVMPCCGGTYAQCMARGCRCGCHD